MAHCLGTLRNATSRMAALLKSNRTFQWRGFAALPEEARLLVLRMPQLSHVMQSGRVKQWHHNVGDGITDTNIICDIVSDNVVGEENKQEEWDGDVTLELEAHEDGFIAAILQPPEAEGKGNKSLKVGEPLAIFCEEQEHVPVIQDMVQEGKTEEVLRHATRDVVWQAYRKAQEGEQTGSSCMR